MPGDNVEMTLYIPLCFLLILYICIAFGKSVYALHSTMFSINLEQNEKNPDVDCTLHSTMFSINLSQRGHIVSEETLYIPLCFLLIYFYINFTTHGALSLHSTMFSINHFQGVSIIQSWYTLHSTMFSINPALK